MNRLETEQFVLGYTDQKITPYAGLVLLKNFLDKIRFRDVASTWHLPQPGSNRGYDPTQIIEQMIVSVWAGAENYSQTDISRSDPAIQRVFDWTKVAEHKAIQRFLQKFNLETSSRYMREVYQWLYSQIPMKAVNIELDSTVVTRSGKQIEGAKIGYNPRYRGRNSHHPLIAFIGSMRLIVNFWLRPGNCSTANNLTAFFNETLANLGRIKVGMVRADSGFWMNEFIEELKAKSIPYIISAKMTKNLQREMINRVASWRVLSDGIQISEFTYPQTQAFEAPQRIIVVRQNIEKKGEQYTSGKSLTLFGDEYENEWRYSAMSTNLPFEDSMIWDMYRQRANCENQIKELKEDFGLNSYVMRDFWATEAGLTTNVLAYNLMSLFRQLVLRLKSQPKLSTIQKRFIYIAGIFQESENEKPCFRLAIQRKKRRWFENLWAASRAEFGLLGAPIGA